MSRRGGGNIIITSFQWQRKKEKREGEGERMDLLRRLPHVLLLLLGNASDRGTIRSFSLSLFSFNWEIPHIPVHAEEASYIQLL